MKKLLAILGVLTMMSTTSSVVVACGEDNTSDNSSNNKPVDPESPTDPNTPNEDLIDLAKLQYKNLPAGFMEAGAYDRNNGKNLGSENNENQVDFYKINSESVLFSLNQMNKLSLSSDDVDISEISNGESHNGYGGVAVIKAKTGSKKAKGEASLILNQSIDFKALVGNTNLDNIYIKEDIFNDLENQMKNESNMQAFAAFIIEQIGVANPALEALATPMMYGAAGIIPNTSFTPTEFNISKTPSLDGLFVAAQDLVFKTKFVKDDRVVLTSSDTQNIQLNKTVNQDSKNNYIEIKKAAYNKLGNTGNWKSKVDVNEFIKYSRVEKKESGYTVYVISGSSKIYGHDVLLPFVAGKLLVANAVVDIEVTIAA
ncbi:lipoprotein [Spiroplasma tabanidicola]|uniref:Lipoprotein n=1 Tax=Spiroplasma tabanidicola TaxID=324079 RepID=A0A6I6CHP0_9MOLU|nr:lipoprotein [Spiroplasma tabanidicola]QGS51563.1 hypothetical protein STABA_v1c01960 [Spiroplasma tabanidicola]